MSKNVDPWYNTELENKNKLNYVSIALLGACNMSCIFCYVGGNRSGMWSPKKIESFFDEAYELGMKKIQLSGGEPLMYPYLEEILEHLSSLKLEILMATNGTLITPKKAELLAKHKVKVGISFETVDNVVSDKLSGAQGSHNRKLEGIKNLKKVGYAYSPDLPLNIIIKTFKQNFCTYINTWKWAKAQGIQPILDRAIPSGRCRLEWVIEPYQLRYLLYEIGKIEGIYHRIPFVNNEGCNRMGCSVHIEVDGNVYPCAGIPVNMGNVNKYSLTTIWKNSEISIHLRNYKDKLWGSCKTCNEKDICCGCRAVAYAITGDMFGPDPLCWNYKKEL